MPAARSTTSTTTPQREPSGKTPAAPKKERKVKPEFASLVDSVYSYKRDNLVFVEKSIDSDESWKFDPMEEIVSQAIEKKSSPAFLPFKINGEATNVLFEGKIDLSTYNFNDKYDPTIAFSVYVKSENYESFYDEMIDELEKFEYDITPATKNMEKGVLNLKLKVNARFPYYFPPECIAKDHGDTVNNLFNLAREHDNVIKIKARFGIYLDLVDGKIGIYNSVQSLYV